MRTVVVSLLFILVFHAVSYGTLVVVVPTKKAILVCADKRRAYHYNDDTKSLRDDVVKIYPLGRKALLVSAGTSLLESRVSGSILIGKRLDLGDFIAEFFDMHPGFTVENWTQLKASLKNELQLWSPELSKSKLKGSPFPPYGLMLSPRWAYEAKFFYLDEGGIKHGAILWWVYDDGLKPVFFNSDIVIRSLFDEYFLKGTPDLQGSPELFYELKSGHDERFAQLRADKRLRPFFDESTPSKARTLEEARIFAQLMIKLTSEQGHLLNEDIEVSPNFDCAKLDYKSGFKWLVQNGEFKEEIKQTTPNLGGHLKTGHTWSLQNRPMESGRD